MYSWISIIFSSALFNFMITNEIDLYKPEIFYLGTILSNLCRQHFYISTKPAEINRNDFFMDLLIYKVCLYSIFALFSQSSHFNKVHRRINLSYTEFFSLFVYQVLSCSLQKLGSCDYIDASCFVAKLLIQYNSYWCLQNLHSQGLKVIPQN